MQLIHDLEKTRDETLTYFSLDHGISPGRMRLESGRSASSYTTWPIARPFFPTESAGFSASPPVLWVFDQDALGQGSRLLSRRRSASRVGCTKPLRNAVIYFADIHHEQKGHLEFAHSVTGVRTLKDEFDKVASHNEHYLRQIRLALGVDSRLTSACSRPGASGPRNVG